jgi:hypothetical protein
MLLYELETTEKRPILYLDMDGVLADFYTPFNNMAGVSSWKDASKDTISAVLKQIANKKDFWINLDVLSDVPKLLQAVTTLFRGEYKILSKALAGDKDVVSQKRQWVQTNLQPQPNEVIIMPATGNKGSYAQQPDGTANILIDDFGYNIKQWKNAGGIGIQHTNGSVNNTIQQLKSSL